MTSYYVYFDGEFPNIAKEVENGIGHRSFKKAKQELLSEFKRLKKEIDKRIENLENPPVWFDMGLYETLEIKNDVREFRDEAYRNGFDTWEHNSDLYDGSYEITITSRRKND